MLYLSNAFSCNMMPEDSEVSIVEVSIESVKDYLTKNKFSSVVGHQDTASIISELLGFEINMNRQSISLEIGDRLIVAQYSGPRLPEGTTRLPEGAKIRWMNVFVLDSAWEQKFIDF